MCRQRLSMGQIRRAALQCFAVFAWCWSAASAAQSSACQEQGVTPSSMDRITALEYRCIELNEGTHVWVGTAGRVDRPAVMLVHGLGNNAHRDWRQTVPALLADYHVIALDLPGFGASQPAAQGYTFPAFASAIVQVANELKIERMRLVGHSLGAAASLYTAYHHPQRIEHLVLVSTAGILLKPVFARHLLETHAAASGLSALTDLTALFGRHGAAGLMDELLHDEAGLSRWLLANVTARGALFGVQVHADAAMNLVEQDFSAAIVAVRAPTTVIWGRDDGITPLRVGVLLAARMPQARLDIIEGAQHMVMAQRPVEFNTRLLRALREPMAVKSAARDAAHGTAECRQRRGVTYTGAFERIVLRSCTQVRIENAQLGELIVEDSVVTLENVVIAATDVAVQARQSTVTATAVEWSGRIAIRSEDSLIDVAGGTLRGIERGVEAQRSRVYLSVSRYDAPEYQGDAHFVWTPARMTGRHAAP